MPVGVNAEAGDAGSAAGYGLGSQNTVLEHDPARGQDIGDGQAGQDRVDRGRRPIGPRQASDDFGDARDAP